MGLETADLIEDLNTALMLICGVEVTRFCHEHQCDRTGIAKRVTE